MPEYGIVPSMKNKTTKIRFVVEIHPCDWIQSIISHLFLFGGLFRLLCRGFLRRHVIFTPFPVRNQDSFYEKMKPNERSFNLVWKIRRERMPPAVPLQGLQEKNYFFLVAFFLVAFFLAFFLAAIICPPPFGIPRYD